MKLTYFTSPTPNFGDELNPWMWERLLPPGFLDEDDDELFVGIGSILSYWLPKQPRKFVFGTGYGGYDEPADVTDGNWDVRFVRGPITAQKVGLPAEAAICDSALLLRTLDLPPSSGRGGVAVIPHFQSLGFGFWDRIVEWTGFNLIDPRQDVETVISEIRGADLVIAEAMHGAIVADALRTPWVALAPVNPAHRMKWMDWAQSLNIDLRRHSMPPTGLLEWYINRTDGLAYYKGRAKKWSESPLAAPVNLAFMARAARSLSRIAKEPPQLSADLEIERCTQRAYEAVQTFISERSL